MTEELTASEGGKCGRRGDEASKKAHKRAEGSIFVMGLLFPFFIVFLSTRGVGDAVAAAADKLVGK